MSVERIAVDTSTPEGRERWLELRKLDVTASSIGALFGVHPFCTIGEIHAAKMGLELPGPDPESAVIRRGNALEAVVATEVGKLRPEWTITKATEYLRDPALRLGCTPDFWIEGDPRGLGVLQTKTVGAWKFKKEWLGDGEEPTPPIWVILQNAVEVMLSDAAFGAIGVLVIGDYAFDCHLAGFERHKATEHKLRVALHSFWHAIRTGQVPTLDPERDGDLVRLMYPAEVEGKVIDLRGDNHIIELLEVRERQAAIAKAAEKTKAAAETEIRARLGDAEIGIVQGWRVTLKTTEVGEQLRKPYSFRALRTAREKEETI